MTKNPKSGEEPEKQVFFRITAKIKPVPGIRVDPLSPDNLKNNMMKWVLLRINN
jgi:hypothetical protein